MLQGEAKSQVIKTIARWDSLQHWQNFWHDERPTQMESMHDLGERVSVEVFKEIDDFTQ